MPDGKSKTCVVTTRQGLLCERWPDCDDCMCGKPVVGERAGWPMCEEHYALFDARRTDA